MSTAGRRLDVLRAIVIEYVNTNEPVASRAVAQSYVMGVSSATIRNDMSVLEEAGLIRQPHTSAGRVPTEAGYRVFVDRLDPSATQLAASRAELAKQLAKTLVHIDSVEDAIDSTVRALAGITGQAAILEYPDVLSEKLRRVELIDLDGRRLLAIVVTVTGKVLEQIVLFPGGRAPSAKMLDNVRDHINSVLAGVEASKIGGALSDVCDSLPPAQQELCAAVCQAVRESTQALQTTRVVTAGAANLARAGIDFSDVARVLEVLEDPAALLQVFRAAQMDPLTISIGAENTHEALAEASLISATYTPVPTPADADASAGGSHVGVIGPTRMDYGRSLAAVEAVSGYLSRLLLRQSGADLEVPEERQEAGEESE